MFKPTGVVTFDKLLEKATSHLLLDADLVSILGICDLIRQKDCPPKYAVGAIKKKLGNQNPHVVYFALQVLDVVVKNCGSLVHDEVATKEFMEHLRELAKTTVHENVRDKVLELVQTWAHAFRKLPTYRAVQDVVNIMKAEGSKFPPLVDTDAMFTADTAPEWQDGGCCNRCRVEFGIMNRKHHCRACGQIFCAKCSSKTATLPKFGIEKEVRVCESCFEKYGKHKLTQPPPPANPLRMASSSDEMLQQAILASMADHNVHKAKSSRSDHKQQAQQPKGKTEEELQEEEQLQLALAISQSEAEAKERESRMRGSSSNNSSSLSSSSNSAAESERLAHSEKESPKKGKSSSGESEDPELARYLDRNYWESRQGSGRDENSREETAGVNYSPNAPPAAFPPSAPIIAARNRVEVAEEIDTFMDSLRGQIEMFNNRMKSNSSRGRHISNDTSVQGLFMNITALHSQLLMYIKAQDDSRSHYEGLQDKLSQVRDARDALNALRNEHNDRIRKIAEEAERQRQMQMAIKLNAMREKKHQYLQYQQEIALRRVQEEERQMQLRIEQQRMIPNVGVYAGYPPQGYMPGPPQPGMGMPQQDPQMMYMTASGQYIPGHLPPQHQQYQPQQGQFVPQQPGQMQVAQQMPGQIQQSQQMPAQIQQPQYQAQMQQPQQHGQMPPPQGQEQPGQGQQMQQAQGQLQGPTQSQAQVQAPNQGQFQGPAPNQGQYQGPPQAQVQFQPPPQGQIQSPQGQMQSPQGQNQMQQPPAQGQFQGPPPNQAQAQQQQFYAQQPAGPIPMAQPPPPVQANGSSHDMVQTGTTTSTEVHAEPSTAELISFE